VLVFDLGGGTFDATLMSVKDRVVHVLATGGDAFLGGANFDEAIAEHFVAHFENKNALSISSNARDAAAGVRRGEHEDFPLQGDPAVLRVPVIAQRADGSFSTSTTPEPPGDGRHRRAAGRAVRERVRRRAGAREAAAGAGRRARAGRRADAHAGDSRRLHRFKNISSDKQVNPSSASRSARRSWAATSPGRGHRPEGRGAMPLSC